MVILLEDIVLDLGSWVCNTESPLDHITTINNELNIDCKIIASGGSIWGLVRTTALEIDSSKITIVLFRHRFFIKWKRYNCLSRS